MIQKIFTFILCLILCPRLFCQALPEILPIKKPSTSLYLQGNFYVKGDRFFRLSDGSYWKVKLKHGWIWSDYSGADWWRGDLIRLTLDPQTDRLYDHLFLNVSSQEIVRCQQVDPAIAGSLNNFIAVIQHIPPTAPSASSDSALSIFAFIQTSSYQFIRLADGSYWELEDKASLEAWDRFDEVEMVKDQGREAFPYLCFNKRNQEQVRCRQVDPAIPDSIHFEVKVIQKVVNYRT